MTSPQTYDCLVTVKTQYLADQSNIEASQYVFSYTIQITNTGTVAAQLISRHWVITDSNNKTQEVRGLGVAQYPSFWWRPKPHHLGGPLSGWSFGDHVAGL